jgi:hypothetical protein
MLVKVYARRQWPGWVCVREEVAGQAQDTSLAEVARHPVRRGRLKRTRWEGQD